MSGVTVALRCNASIAPGKTCTRTTTMVVSADTRFAALTWRCFQHRPVMIDKCYGCGRYDMTLSYDEKFGGIGCVDCVDRANRERA